MPILLPAEEAGVGTAALGCPLEHSSKVSPLHAKLKHHLALDFVDRAPPQTIESK